MGADLEQPSRHLGRKEFLKPLIRRPSSPSP
jgi:hypothetical protein